MIADKLYTKVVKDCHQCPACYQPTGQGYYCCSLKLNLTLGYDDGHLPIPKECPLKDFNGEK
jgi:hypothetical protein